VDDFIEITFNIVNGTPVFNPLSIPLSQANLVRPLEGSSLDPAIPIINISNPTNFTAPILWKFNNVQIDTGPSLDLNTILYNNTGDSFSPNGDILSRLGDHVITVEVVLASNNRPYSASFVVKVNE
jgi:hypothetical protein